RWEKARRPFCKVKATSARFRLEFSSKQAARFLALASSAEGVRAESTTRWFGREGPEGSNRGASSRMTWALVPPTPNALTPARRGKSFLFHSISFEAG